ncbi:hypothetical protein IJT93_12480 [bacterium]|nr:hypothetical protein [bacterium]
MMISSIAPNTYIQSAAPVTAPAASQPKAAAEQSAQPQITDTLSQTQGEAPQIASRSMLQALTQPSVGAKAEGLSQSAAAAEVEAAGGVMSDDEVAAACNKIAVSGAPIAERTESIMELLAPAVERTESPDPTWEKATPAQLKLFVAETLEHIDGLRAIGDLRGLDFSHHDMEEGCGKFHPQVAQFLALPGRNDAVKWGIAKHNGAHHHDIWKDPNASKEDLAESASDIVNAWRMERPVYSKPSWSWEKVMDVINSQFEDNIISSVQRDALYEAIPFQMEYEQSRA